MSCEKYKYIQDFKEQKKSCLGLFFGHLGAKVNKITLKVHCKKLMGSRK
jgi:hypothetical protein